MRENANLKSNWYPTVDEETNITDCQQWWVFSMAPAVNYGLYLKR